MEKQVEFFVSPQGKVCFYGHDGKVLSYSIEHPEFINHMAELISRLYPLRGICPRENIVCLPKLKTPFFPKELEVAKYFAQGYVAREIAEILGKSKNTVSAQLRKMTKRLGLQSTRDIIKVVHQLNL